MCYLICLDLCNKSSFLIFCKRDTDSKNIQLNQVWRIPPFNIFRCVVGATASHVQTWRYSHGMATQNTKDTGFRGIVTRRIIRS